ncbi:hypothetical protein J2853_001330 [Streptosporangium lutulentum]|uniref:Uncharacterized protein n=1 Tax=Streptosporangium lutulentum TaxID=1461250 RepID=A0ABT9Q7R0_9ACTN|nr:hypothetical protein [Streptosporangium lutulentum]MDP9842119.1 hypothetical protein [Streptosporangium lutulentum]
MEQRPTAVVSGHKDRPGRTTPAPSTGPAAISWTSDDRSPKGPLPHNGLAQDNGDRTHRPDRDLLG